MTAVALRLYLLGLLFAGVDFMLNYTFYARQDTRTPATDTSGQTARELCEAAFSHAGLDYREFVEIDPRYLRRTEVDHLCGDSAKARRRLPSTNRFVSRPNASTCWGKHRIS